MGANRPSILAEVLIVAIALSRDTDHCISSHATFPIKACVPEAISNAETVFDIKYFLQLRNCPPTLKTVMKKADCEEIDDEGEDQLLCR